MSHLTRLTSASLVITAAVVAPSAFAQTVNLATCQTAEECGITKLAQEPIVPTGGVAGVGAGDLIKLANDGIPATHEDEAVYYLDKDWVRHAFPNTSVYKSWYANFSGIKELTREQMASFRLGKNVSYRPGTRLIKIPSIAKVYAVEPGGSLRWVESEAVAIALFGKDWNKRVDDVSETLFTDYKEGVPLTLPTWPTGTVVRRNEDGALFLIDGFGRRTLTEASLSTMHLNAVHAIRASEAVIATYPDIGTVSADERRFKDTAQQDYLETLPPPQFDIAETALEIPRDTEVTLAKMRVISGMSVIVRQVKLKISGPLRGADAANLTDIHITDGQGNDLFGIQQLPYTGTEEAALTFAGAYTVKAETAGEMRLVAKVAPGLSAGTVFTVTFDRAGLNVADGGNGEILTRYYRVGEFPAVQAKLK